MGRYIQRIFIFKNLTYLAIVMVAACFAAYGVLYKALSSKLTLSFGGAFYQMKSVHDGMDLIVWFSTTLYGILTWTCILAICLFATHKVAGPLFRLELALKEAMEGAFPPPFVFRDGDQIAPLAEVKNRLFDYLKTREDRYHSLADELDSLRLVLEGEMIREGGDPEKSLLRIKALLEQAAVKDGRPGEAGP